MNATPPMRARMRDLDVDAAAMSRLWTGVRRRSDRKRRLSVLAGTVGVLGAAAATGLFVTLLEVTGRPVQAIVSRDARVRVPDTGTEAGGVKAEPGPGAEVWTTPTSRAASKAAPVAFDVTRGSLHVDNVGGTPCVIQARRFTIEVASAEVRVTSSDEDDFVVVAVGEAVVRGRDGSVHTVKAGETFGSEGSWLALARSGQIHAAWAALGDAGVQHVARGASPGTVALLADVAAAGGDHASAIELLASVVAAPRVGDLERAVAAYDLGLKRIEVGQFAKAAEAFELSLSLDLPSTLRREARARAAEARAHALDEVASQR